MRHHSRADDSDRDIQHAGLTKVGRNQGPAHFQEARPGLRQNEDLDEVAHRDRGDQQNDHGLDGAHPESLQGEEQQHVQAGDDDRPEERDMEQQVEGDGAAQHFRQVACADGHFAHQPVGPARPPRIPVAAALGEVLAGHHAESRGNYLHENGHQAGQADHPQQPVLELSATLQVRPPVAGVHVANADQNRRPDESPPLLPESGLMVRHLDGAMHPLQRDVAAVATCLGRYWTMRIVPSLRFCIHSSTNRRTDGAVCATPTLTTVKKGLQAVHLSSISDILFDP